MTPVLLLCFTWPVAATCYVYTRILCDKWFMQQCRFLLMTGCGKLSLMFNSMVSYCRANVIFGVKKSQFKVTNKNYPTKHF